jgi:hypothetical protein
VDHRQWNPGFGRQIESAVKERQKPNGENRIANNTIFQGIQRGPTTERRTLEDAIGKGF